MRGERFLPRRSFVTHGPWQQTSDRLNHDRSCQLSAAQYVVSNRKLTVGKKIHDAFVDSFVASGEQNDTIERGELGGDRLAESSPLCRKQDDALVRSSPDAFLAGGESERIQTFKDRCRLQDHAFAAAKWAVVHGAVSIMRELPQIVDFNFRQAHFRGPAGNAVIQRSAKEVRKDRDNIGLHWLDPCSTAESAKHAENSVSLPLFPAPVPAAAVFPLPSAGR